MAKAGVWSVGTIAISGDEGESGTVVLVVDEDLGALVANDLWAAMDEGEAVATSLKQLFGEVGRPRKLLVKTGALAKSVRAAGVREEIVVGATPKLDEVTEALERDAAALASFPGPLDDSSATGELLSTFYAAADVMRQVAPWGFLPQGAAFAVEAQALGISEGAVFVVASTGEDEEAEDAADGEAAGDAEAGASEAQVDDDRIAAPPPGGWMFVESPEDFEAMTGAMTDGFGRDRASVIALAYERIESLGPAFEELAREHQIDVPADGWVPVLSRAKRGVGQVPVSGSDYELATALCSAIANITVALAEEDDGEEHEGIRAELETPSGMQIFVEGPIAEDEDDEEDDGKSE